MTRERSSAAVCSRGEIFGGGRGGGEDVDHLIHSGEFQAGLHHAIAPGQAQRASGVLEARVAADHNADRGAVNVGDAGKIEDGPELLVLEKLLHFAFDAAAVRTSVNAAAEREQGDAVFQFAFGDFKNQCVGSVYREVEILGGDGRLVAFVGELANQAHAIHERIENRIAPAAGDEGCRFLVHGFVGFGEEAQALAGRRRGKFLDGDAERDIAAGLALHDREKVELGKLFSGIFLRELPVAHPWVPRVESGSRTAKSARYGMLGQRWK